jgi:dTDP-4-dehydrorhamnose reductase
MKYLVIGGSGFLGREVLRVLGKAAKGTFSAKSFEGGLPFDGASGTLCSLEPDLGGMPEVVFLLHGNANPDFCARHPELTRQANVVGMKRLVRETWEIGALPVYMSTDYVFDGTRGLRTENEPRCPTTEYGRQKAEIEEWLEESGQQFLVCRSSKIISGDRDTHSVLGQWLNELEAGKLLRCAVDQIFSPAHVNDTALSMRDLVAVGARGLFNVAGPEPVSRYDLAKMLLEANLPYSPGSLSKLVAINLADIPFYDPRPLNTSLDVSKLDGAIHRRFRSLSEICKEIAIGSSPTRLPPALPGGFLR